MPRLQDGEVYRRIRPVDLAPVLGVLHGLRYTRSGQTGKYVADVVLGADLPLEVWRLVASLDLGGSLGRAIIRKLGPRQHIPTHVDDWMPKEHDWRRFQVPLTSHPEIKMRWPDDGVEMHLEPGWLYEVRYDRTHEVVHGADCDRLHLQVDQVNATI